MSGAVRISSKARIMINIRIYYNIYIYYMYMVYHGLTLEAYESEVDQILKDANAKVRKLAEAVESGTQDLGTHGLRMGSTYREC